MFVIALLSLLAGVLTVLSPCALPLLPIIVGGSVTHERSRPYVVTASLLGSLLVFTLLLKASTLLIAVPAGFWEIFSGALIVSLGLSMLFPSVWTWISMKTGLESASSSMLVRAHNAGARPRPATTDPATADPTSAASAATPPATTDPTTAASAATTPATASSPVTTAPGPGGPGGAVLTGIALGPVFSSCSPTYAWVLATVLPSRPLTGLFYITLYCLGLAGALLLISLAGHSMVRKLGWAANPRGWFQRAVAIVFIVVGLLVATGTDRAIQSWAVDHLPVVNQLEEKLLPNDSPITGSAGETTTGQVEDSDPQLLTVSAKAPEIEGIDTWLNSEPLKLADLRGKVVLIDFWTYSCVNCIRTQPVLNSWYERYHDEGFEIIGVHAPEFAFEKLPQNVQKAIDEEQIKYPVALDNDFRTWNAFYNQYWPAKYLIDKSGNIRYFHFGEGEYERTETAIRTLLESSGDPAQKVTVQTGSAGQSPETYLGLLRTSGFVGNPRFGAGVQDYVPAPQPGNSQWTLSGKWKAEDERVTAAENGATLTYSFTGRKVFLVLTGEPGAKLRVQVDGRLPGGEDVQGNELTIDRDRLYNLVDLGGVGTGTVTITFPKGVSAHAFTFG
ncbi:MAG: redoxin domain-containing protein [Actinomycetaceae bacterium]|nr:redoxin domain-containing protein [Actinomycetaceae bacterium]